MLSPLAITRCTSQLIKSADSCAPSRSGSESLEGRTFGRRPKLLFLKRSLLVVRINKFGKPHYGPYMSSESETMRSNVDLISF